MVPSASNPIDSPARTVRPVLAPSIPGANGDQLAGRSLSDVAIVGRVVPPIERVEFPLGDPSIAVPIALVERAPVTSPFPARDGAVVISIEGTELVAVV